MLGRSLRQNKRYFSSSLKRMKKNSDICHLKQIKKDSIIHNRKKFLSPSNPEIYLEQSFGKNWKIPDKKQFLWNKNL